MKTAEVAIEHVLAGLLAICAFVLPFLPGVRDLGIDNTAIVGVLGLAYLLGVVFDRVADTLLSAQETFLRLEVALHNIARSGEPPPDPFPQDDLEYTLREEDHGRVEWMDSLRSRIRTARELAVFGLPAALGLATYLSRETEGCDLLAPLSATAAQVIGWCFVVANAAMTIRAVATASGATSGYRTDEYFADERAKQARRIANTMGRKLEANESRQTRNQDVRAQMRVCLRDASRWRDRRSRPLRSIWVLSLLGATLVAIFATDERIAVLVAGAGGLVFLANWTWRRVTRTYLGFVSRAHAAPTAP